MHCVIRLVVLWLKYGIKTAELKVYLIRSCNPLPKMPKSFWCGEDLIGKSKSWNARQFAWCAGTAASFSEKLEWTGSVAAKFLQFCTVQFTNSFLLLDRLLTILNMHQIRVSCAQNWYMQGSKETIHHCKRMPVRCYNHSCWAGACHCTDGIRTWRYPLFGATNWHGTCAYTWQAWEFYSSWNYLLKAKLIFPLMSHSWLVSGNLLLCQRHFWKKTENLSLWTFQIQSWGCSLKYVNWFESLKPCDWTCDCHHFFSIFFSDFVNYLCLKRSVRKVRASMVISAVILSFCVDHVPVA